MGRMQSKAEREYQAYLIPLIRDVILPGCWVLKNDSGYQQGIPDLSVFHGPRWAWLEVKAYEGAPEEPNQDYFVQFAARSAFGAFIYPENEQEVLDGLQSALCLERQARQTQSKQLSLGAVRRR